MKGILKVKDYLNSIKGKSASVLVKVGQTHHFPNGMDQVEFHIDISTLSQTDMAWLRVTTDRDIYYGDSSLLLVSAGENVPYYSQLFSDEQVSPGTNFVAMVDFRMGDNREMFNPDKLTREFVLTARYDEMELSLQDMEGLADELDDMGEPYYGLAI